MTTTRRLLLSAGLAAGLGGTVRAGDGDGSLALDLVSDASARGAVAPQDQKFTVDVHGFIMFRYNWNQRDSGDPVVVAAGGNENTVGFQSAYTKLQIGGKIFSDAWTYGIQVKLQESDGAMVLDDAWGAYTMENGWQVKWGQFKLPLLREELISDTAQLTANRSVLNSVFSQSRSQGVQFSTEQQGYRLAFAFSDGLSTKNTDYTSASEADFGLTARGEFKWAGDWKQAKDFTSFKGSPFFGMVGVAAHYQDGGETFATADASLLEATADVSLEGDGWNGYAAAIYRSVDPSGGSSLNDMGFLIQGGIFVGPTWELFARYDVVVPDTDRATDDTFSTVTIGANHYFVPDSHAAKLTLDFQFFLDKQSGSIAPASTLTGLLASDNDSQWNLRAQMQLVF